MQLTTSTTDQLMAMAAHRYCLGRQSYIVSACLEWLRATWNQFTDQTGAVMVRDTIEALQDGRCGSATIDEPGWRAFARHGMDRLPDRWQRWVRNDIAQRGKPWPL